MHQGISRETFDTMEVEAKLGVLFDYAQESHQCIELLKKRPIIDKFFAFAGGVIGGAFVAFGAKWKI